MGIDPGRPKYRRLLSNLPKAYFYRRTGSITWNNKGGLKDETNWLGNQTSWVDSIYGSHRNDHLFDLQNNQEKIVT